MLQEMLYIAKNQNTSKYTKSVSQRTRTGRGIERVTSPPAARTYFRLPPRHSSPRNCPRVGVACFRGAAFPESPSSSALLSQVFTF